MVQRLGTTKNILEIRDYISDAQLRDHKSPRLGVLGIYFKAHHTLLQLYIFPDSGKSCWKSGNAHLILHHHMALWRILLLTSTLASVYAEFSQKRSRNTKN